MGSYTRVGQETSAAIEVHYEDHGYRSRALLIYGWPLNRVSRQEQTGALRAEGHALSH
jgi:non-heme chloroperoxidase